MGAEQGRPLPRAIPIRPRSLLVVLVLGAAAWSAAQLRLRPADIVPSRPGLATATTFLGAALSPAIAYESEVPAGTRPILWKAALAARTTLVFAAAATSLALVGGVVLGFLGSSAWWTGDPAAGAPRWRRPARALAPLVWGATRVLIAFLRSVHELLWAVLLLAALGRSPLAAVLAIAVPYTGVLAKVFSEIVDEAPRDGASALRDAGASPLQVFLFGLVPRALPDMVAYGCYRFECALRSSAILGFFGFPTLGYFIAASFENLHHREVWTYLYVLFALVAIADGWSGALRRRLVR